MVAAVLVLATLNVVAGLLLLLVHRQIRREIARVEIAALESDVQTMRCIKQWLDAPTLAARRRV